MCGWGDEFHHVHGGNLPAGHADDDHHHDHHYHHPHHHGDGHDDGDGLDLTQQRRRIHGPSHPRSRAMTHSHKIAIILLLNIAMH